MLDRFPIEPAATGFGHKDQSNVHCGYTVFITTSEGEAVDRLSALQDCLPRLKKFEPRLARKKHRQRQKGFHTQGLVRHPQKPRRFFVGSNPILAWARFSF
jgi:hypothetical protein